MDCHKIHDSLTLPGVANFMELEKKANKTIEFPHLAITTGNAIVLFTMLVLQETFVQLAVNPTANLASMILISNSIASLNSSMKIIQ